MFKCYLLLQRDEEDTLLACIEAFDEIYTNVITNETMYMDKVPETHNGINTVCILKYDNRLHQLCFQIHPIY